MSKSSKVILDINDNLNKIFSKSFLVNETKNKQFQELILKQISILAFYEASLKKTKSKSKEQDKNSCLSSQEWLDKLNQINNTKLSLIEVNYKNDVDAIDDANYIKTYIQNVYHLNIDDAENNDVIQAKTVQNIDDNSKETANPFSGVFSDIGGDTPITMGDFQEQFYKQVALQKFHKELSDGNFYQYKTKPKIIPILKYVVSSFLILFALITVIKIILIFMSNNVSIINPNKEHTSTELNLIKEYLIGDILNLICSSYMSYIVLKPAKNDNNKYYFSWKLFTFISVIWFINLIMNLVFNIELLSLKEGDGNNIVGLINKYQVFKGYIYTSFGTTAIFALVIILVVVSSVFNPKVDSDRIKQKLDSLYNEIKSSNAK